MWPSFLRIWSHLLKKYLIENFTFFCSEIFWSIVSKLIKTHFTIQSSSINLILLLLFYSFYISQPYFTNPNLLDIENNMLLKESQKHFSLSKFSCKHNSAWFQKKSLHCTTSWCPRTTFLPSFLMHFESKYLYISVYLLEKSFVQKT